MARLVLSDERSGVALKLPRLDGLTGLNEDGKVKPSRILSRYWDALCDAIEGAVSLSGSPAMTGPLFLATYDVADLPTAGEGQVAYASNGRKNGEGPGLGTGVMVFSDATAWRACDTGATVAA